jgi:ABC-type polysaccharide/polyol phosphate transport system ATPase subunit
MEPIVSIRNVSKRYQLYDSPKQRLKDALLPFGRRSHREFWALRDISFDVSRGQALGIIGRNGCGKSTLLQIVCGVLRPTAGQVVTRGRISALLELGAGFNPEYTGRNNVYMNLALAGFTRQEIDDRFESIERFAEIGEFIDQPVKVYSTGLFVRLAFASAVSVEPDILVVDEALSVGDIFFQQKCFKRIRQIIDAGTTLLFVSHDAAVVQNICDTGILLSNGEIAFVGSPEECVSRYFASEGRRLSPFAEEITKTQGPKPVSSEIKSEMLQNNILSRARSRNGNQALQLLAATFQNEHGEHSMSVEMMKSATIRVLLHAREPILCPSTGLHLYDRMANLVFAAGTRQLHFPMDPMAAGEERVIGFKLGFSVQPGEYTFSLGCGEPSAQGANFGFIHDRYEGLGPVSVHYEGTAVMPFYGVASLPMTISTDGE